MTEGLGTVGATNVVQGAMNEVGMSGSDGYDGRKGQIEEEGNCFICIQDATERRLTGRDPWPCLHTKTVDGKCLLQRICTCGLRRKCVCTYTTSRVPTSDTEKLRDVLEIGRTSIVQHAVNMGIAIAIKARDGLGS